MRSLTRAVACASLLLLGVFSSGCATHTGEGAVLGSLLGAGAGAIIGHAAGDSGAGAIIGAGSGAVIGGLIGNSYDAYDHGYARGRYGPPPRHAYPAPPPHYEHREFHYYDYGPRYYVPPPHVRFHYRYDSRPRHHSYHRPRPHSYHYHGKRRHHGRSHRYGYRYGRYRH